MGSCASWCPAVDVPQVQQLSKELANWISVQHNNPILVRLAWHDSGTYNKDSTAPWPEHGGADASIRFKPEIDHAANKGLSVMIQKLEPIHQKFPNVSYADLYQLASAVAIESAGGPHIPLRFGRLDCPKGHLCPEEGALPNGRPPFSQKTPSDPIQHLKDVFYRLGLTDQEICVLSGAHTLGRAYKDRSGATDRDSTKYTEKVKPGMTPGGQSWTADWLKFDNQYFKDIKAQQDSELLVMDTDNALNGYAEWKKWVDIYASDQDRFFLDYAKAQVKLSELGSKWVDDKPVEVDF